MNKYNAGKGRNRSKNPRPYLYYAGLGHRLLASAIPEMRANDVRSLPHQMPEVESLRARRRAGENIPRQRPVGDFPDNPFNSFPHSGGRLTNVYESLRALSAQYPVNIVSPTGRTPRGIRSAFDLGSGDHSAVVIIDSLSQMREPVNNAVVQMANAAQQMATAFGTSIGSAVSRIRSMRPSDEMVYFDIESSAHPDYLRHWFNQPTEEEREAAAKAEEEAKIKERLAGREVGQVIRRPRRTVAGFTVIDAMTEDGNIARTIVNREKE